MSNEGFEQEGVVDVERAMDVLASSDEAIAREEAVDLLMAKWGTDRRVENFLDRVRGEESKEFDRSALWGMAAAGGFFASMYGLPDNMMQYFDSVGQFQLAEFSAQISELGGGILAAIKSWEAFAEGFKINRATKRFTDGKVASQN